MAITTPAARTAAADPPPLALYAALPAAQDLRLSPDGTALTMIGPVQDAPALMVKWLDGERKPTVLMTGRTLPDWVQWKTPSRLLASVRFTAQIRGEPVAETRLIFLDADGGNRTSVRVNKPLPPTGAAVYGNPGNKIPQIQDQVISLLPDDPDHLLLAVTPEQDYLHPEVLRIDVHSGQGERIQRTLPDVVAWSADSSGAVRLARKIGHTGWGKKDVHITYLLRDSDLADWRVIHEQDADQGPRFVPVGFAEGDANSLYVLADDANGRLVARRFDSATLSLGPELLSDPQCDVEALLQNYQVIGFNIPCRNDGVHYLAPERQKDLDSIRRALKTPMVRITDRTRDGRRSLVVSHGSTSAPARFWLLDRSSGKAELSPLGDAYPGLPDDQIAPVQLVSYPARDGTPIPALLTLPVAPRRGPIAFVVLPHGGPTAHDAVQFDWIVQFLASRGFGVLQPQFRGSSGYGLAFQEAGYQQWGLLMQDDITDGTRWLVTQKLADPRRICIVGASFGGYAALMGAVKEPDLYACAAAFAPVTDLDSLVNRLRMFAFKDLNLPRIKSDGQSLSATSPVDHADAIRVPVLLMHGREDFTVPVDHSEEMERALRRAGKPVQAIYLEHADHYFASGKDRTAWLTALDSFLAAALAER